MSIFRRHGFAIPSLLGILVFAVYILGAPNDLEGNGDTLLRYQTTQAIVDHAVIHYVSTTADPAPKWIDKRSELGVDRKRYTIYAPGQIFAMIPLYILGKFAAHRLTRDYIWTPLYVTHILDDIFGALLAIVFFLLALRLGYGRWVATVLTLIFAFASVAFPDAESMLEHTQVTFFLSLGVLLALVHAQSAFRRRRLVLASGLALGCAFLTRYDTGVLLWIIPAFLALGRISAGKPLIHAVDPAVPENLRRTFVRMLRVAQSDRRVWTGIAGDWTCYLVGLIPALAAAGAWNYARFGSVTKTGIPATFGEPIQRGLSGLLLSPGKGIIWYMPILFALPFVIPAFWRQHRLITLLFASIVITELLLFSTVIYWHGDPAWGPRYIYPITPFVVLPLGLTLERWAVIGKQAQRLFIGLVALSLAIQVVGVITPQYRFWYQEIRSQLAARQGFNWGSKFGHFWYFYYWDLSRNPILKSFDNLYQVTAIRVFDQRQYRLWQSPIPPSEHLVLYNPEHAYEINNYNLWWLAARNPFLGIGGDAVLAGFWVLIAAGSTLLLREKLNEATTAADRAVVELNRRPA